MKALILVGGFGTRLRPLTLSCPKPLVEFINEPMIVHQIRALQSVGVDSIVMACQYKAQLLEDRLSAIAKELGISLIWSIEKEPMGTAGPIAIAHTHLKSTDSSEPFFVLNSDVTSIFPLKEMLAFHKKQGKSGTIAVTKVDEPSKYGVVVMDNTDPALIDRFVEKPQIYVGNKINAGIYILNTSVLGSYINVQNPKPTSIERKIFPEMVNKSDLCAYSMPGFWMDIGQPRDYLVGTTKFLDHLSKKNKSKLSSGPQYRGNVLIHPTAKIGKDCFLGPNVVIGKNCIIEDGVRISNSVLLDTCKIGSHSWLKDSIIGWKSKVGRWVRLQNLTVLGESVKVEDEIFMNGVSVLPHKTITETIPHPKVVM